MPINPRTGQTIITPFQHAQNQPDPRTGAELGVRLLTQALIQRQHDAKQGQRNEALTQALTAKEFRNPDDPTQVLQSRGDLVTQALSQSGDPQLQQFALAQALQGKPETFSPIMDDQGNIAGQRSSTSGRVVSDPCTPKQATKPNKFVNFMDPASGQIQSAREGSPEAEGLVDQGFIRSGNTGGMQLEVGPDGTVQFKQGGVPGQGFGKKTTGGIETSIVGTTERIDRLDSIASTFEPRFLEFSTRFAALKTAFSEKIGFKPSAEDKKLLEDYTRFKRRSMNELNLTIKELSGAAVTETETPRLVAAMPNPGQGLFDGESPTEFKTKLDDTTQIAKAAHNRLIDLRSRGLIGASGKITEDLAGQFPLDNYFQKKDDFGGMGLEDLRSFVLDAKDADIDALPQATQDLIIKRLQENK